MAIIYNNGHYFIHLIRVTDKERRENHAPLGIAPAELLGHRDDRDRDIDPVDIADEGAEKAQQDHRVATLPGGTVADGD